MSRILKSITAIFTLALCFSFTALAQEQTGSIQGTITDPAGAVVPGVEVTIASTAGSTVGFRRTTVADSNGFFRVQQIPPGVYTVTTTAASGFGVATANNVGVTLGAATTINIALAAGGASVEVTVTDDALATIRQVAESRQH